MKTILYSMLCTTLSTLIFSCGTIPSDVAHTGDGSISLVVWINKVQQETKTRATIWSDLVVRVSAVDMNTVHDTFGVTMEKSFYSNTVEKIPAGSNRLVELWTIDNENDMIHAIDSETVDLEPAKTTQVVAELNPIMGSIYLVLTDIPTIVDSVLFAFETADTAWQAKDQREAKLNMCLDKIPFGTQGTLSIIGFTAAQDTAASWKQENFIFSNSNTSIEASFISVGRISIQATIHMPGVTIITGIMDTTDSIGDEMGGLIISEIMYSTNDSEYVELYNPTTSEFNDTIILQKDNGTFRQFHVTIPAKGFLVVGRIELPWGDTYHSTTSALDLSSSTGNWITVRLASDSSVIDNVAFQTGSNEQEWPNFSMSTKASIVLDSLSSSPEYNNFGRNWIAAESPIDTTITQQKGTPGKSGF